MFNKKHDIAFVKNRKIYYVIAAAFIIIGLVLGMVRGFNMGIDFTGGTMMQIDMGSQVEQSEVKDVLKEHDVEASIVHAGENNEQIIIKTVAALDNEARKEILNDLKEKFQLEDKDLLEAKQFGPSVGEMLKKNAVKAIIIASICMLIYIVIRFEWKFGVAAIVTTLHDVLVLIAFYGIFGITVNNPFIAALLTVVGYSINDTIVIFDRIRENLRLMKKSKIEGVIDASINQTLGRSLMTSLTTIIIIIPVMAFGGTTIREFTIPLMVGIIAGTCSSIFIASPIYYQLCKITEKKRYNGHVKKKVK